MIELRNDQLVFRFPEVHPEASLQISLQRTMRIPDDGRTYPLPPGLGCFPLAHVDDYSARVPTDWLERGGVLAPMYQSEAMWLNFQAPYVEGRANYCFAVKVAAGKINAVSGEDWDDGIHRDPQDYLVVPAQPWLDGYCVEKGLIRQFVAMPLGSGYSAEEQITGKAEHGGLQIVVYPMKRDVFDRRFPKVKLVRKRGFSLDAEMCDLDVCAAPAPEAAMGLAPGGTMRQEIYDDPFDFGEWDLRHRSRCFVHLANSFVWRSVTGHEPPTPPPTAAEYDRAGLPWFDYYSDASAVEGGERLKDLKSVKTLATEKGDNPLPENESVTAKNVVDLRADRRAGLGKGQVREW